jgi:hypothetical protein
VTPKVFTSDYVREDILRFNRKDAGYETKGEDERYVDDWMSEEAVEPSGLGSFGEDGILRTNISGARRIS